MKKSQISFEMLVLLAFVFILLIIFLVSFKYTPSYVKTFNIKGYRANLAMGDVGVYNFGTAGWIVLGNNLDSPVVLTNMSIQGEMIYNGTVSLNPGEISNLSFTYNASEFDLLFMFYYTLDGNAEISGSILKWQDNLFK